MVTMEDSMGGLLEQKIINEGVAKGIAAHYK
jgi:hypothetical protein